jgi:hypothetical protein
MAVPEKKWYTKEEAKNEATWAFKEAWEDTKDFAKKIWSKFSKETPESKKEEWKKAATEEAWAEVKKLSESIDLKNNILTKLDSYYTEILGKLDVEAKKYDWTVFKSKAEKKINEVKVQLKEEYLNIRKQIEECKSDKELKNNANIVKNLDKFLWKLRAEDKTEIWDDTIAKIESLKKDIIEGKMETAQTAPWTSPTAPWATPEAKPEDDKTKDAESKAKAAEKKTKFAETLKTAWVPAFAASIIATLFWFFWYFDSSKDSFMAKAVEFLSNPIEGVKSMFWMGDKKEEPKTAWAEPEKAPEIKAGVITKEKDWKTVKYINWRTEITLKDNKIDKIKIWEKTYKLTAKDLKDPMFSKVSFNQTDKGDFIKFGSNEVSITAFVKSASEWNILDKYVIAQNFNWWVDLGLEKIA